MLFHISVEADEPQRVARALAEIMGGEAMPFPPVAEGSWVALAGDERGTMVEVYPRGTELSPTEEGAIGVPGAHRRKSSVHFAMATSLTQEQVLDICRREGWPAHYFRRVDKFGLIEIWVEGCLMIEVLTPAMQREYLDTITIPNWKAMLAEKDAAEQETLLAA